MKKSFLVGLLFSIISYANIFAQNYDEARLETMTNEFIQRAESSDALSLMTNIKSFYSSLSNGNKKKMLSFYISKVSSLLESEKKDNALAVIHLYENLANKDDEKLPSLMFVKGNIYTERMDSTHLKQTILELSNDALKEKPGISDYLSKLNDNLDKIKKYIPPYKKMDGIWVADGLFWNNRKKGHFNSNPSGDTDIYMQVDYDTRMDTIVFCIDNKSELALQMDLDMGKDNVFKKTRSYYSQLVMPYASDSIYVLWSSEKLNKNSPEFAGILRGTVSATAAAVSAELAQNNKHSFSSQLIGGLATSVSEVGLNAVISTLFTPTKRMYVLEARLKYENDYLLTGTITYKYKWIAADGDVYEEKNLQAKVLLSRWLPESNIAFTDYWIKPILHPLSKIAPKDYKKHENTRYAYCKDKIGKGKMFPTKSASAFNIEQCKWLMLYNDSILNAQGYNGESIIDNNFHPYIGIQYSSLDAKMQKKTKEKAGVYVKEVFEPSPAYVGGLKKGDIILSVNDNIMKDKYDMDLIVYNMKAGNWLKLKVLRDKKYLDLLLRVTWQ